MKRNLISLFVKNILFSFLLINPSFAQSFYIGLSPRIACWELGNTNQVTIIINGGPGIDHNYLRPEWDTLSAISKIIFYDQRGCGKSDNSTNYSWIEHIKDIKRIKDSISPINKVIIAGSSWGTYLTLLYSLYFPNDTKAIILSGFPDWRGINSMKVDLNNYKLDSIINFKRSKPLGYKLDSIMKLGMKKLSTDTSTSSISKSKVPKLDKVLHQRSKEAYQMTFNSQPSMPEFTFIEEIKVPTLILKGDSYCGYPDWSDLVANSITGSELVIVNNSCHDPWYSNPTVFFTKCFEFIKQLK